MILGVSYIINVQEPGFMNVGLIHFYQEGTFFCVILFCSDLFIVFDLAITFLFPLGW